MNKSVIIVILFLLISQSCVDRFYLNEYVKFESRMVVDALLDDVNSIQEIKISYSTNPDMPNKEPYSGCRVYIEDFFENSFIFNEDLSNPGSYKCSIDTNLWQIGAKLKLFIETPVGEKFSSNFVEIKPCPEVSAIYYEIERKPTEDPAVTEDGVQFYLDLEADNSYGRFFKWVVEETWEYHSSFVKKRFVDENGIYHKGPVDSSYFICYKTKYISDIFTVSTKDLEINKYDKYKLHFVNDHTQRLLYRYSILVKQYSINEDEHIYWQKIKKNNQESGSFYDKQPSIVDGNIFNIADTNDKVLGYFSVSAMKDKRININGIDELGFESVPYCSGIREGHDTPPTYYIYMSDGEGGYINAFVNDECVICTLLGGTTELPSFWE